MNVSIFALSRAIFLFCLLSLVALLSGCGGKSSKSTRPAAVGRASFDWTDTSRAEKFGPNPGGPRKIAVYLWYPTNPRSGATQGPFLPTSQATILEPVLELPAQTIRSLPTKSYIDSAPATDRGAFPVLVMSHGHGLHPLLYSNTAEYLASRGYIVVGVAHTYNANWSIFSDNSLALGDPAANPTLVAPTLTETSRFADYNQNWTNAAGVDAEVSRDIPFVLDKLAALNTQEGVFKGRLRLDQVGVFGHSFGGSHAFRALQEDARVDAAADLDGSLFNLRFAEGAQKPILFLVGDRGPTEGTTEVRNALLASGMTNEQVDTLLARGESDRKAFENSPNAYYVRLTKAQHSNFSDLGLLAPYGIAQDQISTTASPAELLNTANEYLVGFFDEKIRGIYAPILHRAPASPDVTFEKRP